MILTVATYAFLAVATLPFVYYLIALYSSWRFFSRSKGATRPKSGFTPPVSILKPVRGLDPDVYENFASFCRQDYPEYEIVFCIDDGDVPVQAAIEKLIREFPERRIRVLLGSGRSATNDKVAKLARLVSEAQHEVLVISDSDVRARPDYVATLVAPLADSQVGAVTCFYMQIDERTFVENLQAVSMISDFYAGILVARELDGVKFTLGPTIATTRTRLAGFGGYEAIENCPADDLLVGRLIADQGYTVELLPYTAATVADYQSLRDLLQKRLRWIVEMRQMRPWGHFGLLLTQGLPWSLAAVAVHRSARVALGYLGTYCALRLGMMWTIGMRGLKRRALWKKIPLIAVWDIFAFFIWLASFSRTSFRWRGGEYRIRDGKLVPVVSNPAEG
jgi:ceramide glucosyltransferase